MKSVSSRTVVRTSIAAAVSVIAVLAYTIMPPRAARAYPALSFSVNSSADTHDLVPGDGSCKDGGGQCTLRAAIEEANALGGALTIFFDSNRTISLTVGALNVTADNITIDGSGRTIIVDGSGLSAGQHIFSIQGNANIIRSLTIRNAPSNGIQIQDLSSGGNAHNNVIDTAVIYGNTAGTGVVILADAGGGGQHNTVEFSLIGASSPNAVACAWGESNINGIYVGSDANFTTIRLNAIICNTTGIVMLAGNATISSNIVGGGNGNSTIALPNGDGLSMRFSGAANASITYNTFSGNTGNGVLLIGAHDNSLRGNRIGVNYDKNAAVPNGQSGLAIYNGAYSNTIGASILVQSDINTIGGNAAYGVYIGDSTTVSNTFYNNYIGYGQNGTTGYILPNGFDGIAIDGARNNTIGFGNLVSYNSRSGVYLTGAASGNIVSSNMSLNHAYGVLLDGGSTSNNLIQNSILAENGYDGIGERNGATNNRWSALSVRDNGGLGIDKYAASDLTNIPDMPYPRILTVTLSGGMVTVRGLASANFDNGLAGANTARVELYEAATDPSGFGEGSTFHDAAGTDANGNWQLSFAATAIGCYTAFETNSGFTISGAYNYSGEFGPNSCRIFLPLIRR